MTFIQHKIVQLVLLTVVISGIGCKKYITEQNLGSSTDEIYYVTKIGFEDLARSNYPNLRYIFELSNVHTLGTDIFTTYATTDVSALNQYNVSLNSSLADLENYWKQLYFTIGGANTTLYWATRVQGMDSATLNWRIGEAKALRAYCYFLLTETFGDVPLVLQRATEANSAFTRTPQEQVYTQMIQDLTEAAGILPATTTDFGRITKGFAQHLLAKVYLTRGYRSYGSAADFDQAATLAETLINSGNYSLRPVFSSMFDPAVSGFQNNAEVIFSVQYSITAASNPVYFLGKVQSPAVVGNNQHQYFLWDTQGLAAIGRSTLYNKNNSPNQAVPDPYFFSLFDKVRDSRYTATVWTALIAQVAGSVNGRSFAAGDTVVYYPDIPFTATQKAAAKYFVFNPDEYRTSVFSGQTRSFPLFKKFRDPSVAYSDFGGSRDTYVFRLAETYLLAAEAFLKANNTTKALQYFNAIRARAAKPGTNPATGKTYANEMQVAALTIDDILDERARELSGEEMRWFELKRTGTLITRTLAHNEEAKASNTLQAYHLVRPIPQSQIDLNRGAEFPQNDKY
jgi:hypothetical protein